MVPTPDLNLDPDYVRAMAERCRAAATTVDDAYTDGEEHEVEFDVNTMTESHHHDELAEEELTDQSADELMRMIEGLNVDQSAELVAIVWVGRGDYDAGGFADAVEQARARAVGPTSAYLARMPMLADHLENGLDALGF